MKTLLMCIILLLLVIVYLIISGHIQKLLQLKESFQVNSKDLLFEGFRYFREKLANAISPGSAPVTSLLSTNHIEKNKQTDNESSLPTHDSLQKEELESEDSTEESSEDSLEEVTQTENNKISSSTITTPPLSYTLEELSELSSRQSEKKPSFKEGMTSDTKQYSEKDMVHVLEQFVKNYLHDKETNSERQSSSNSKTHY